MTRFPLVQLRYVAVTGTGHTPPRSRPELWIDAERSIPWVTLADIGQLRYDSVDVLNYTAERITPVGIANSSAVLHPEGTVLLSRTASVGFSAVMGRAMAVSQDFMTWTPGPRLHARFLLYVLRGLRLTLLGLMHGSTHKTIYMPDLMGLKAPLPPLATQRSITHFLDRECHRISTLTSVLVSALSSLVDYRLARTEEHFDAEADGMIAVGRLLARAEQGWSPQCEDRPPEPDEWGVLKAGAVNGGIFRRTAIKTLPADSVPNLAARLRSGDVLMNRASGSLQLLGSVAVAEQAPEKTLFSDKLYRLTPDSRRCPPALLVMLLSLPASRMQIVQGASGGKGLANNLPLSAVRAIRVPRVAMCSWPTLSGSVREIHESTAAAVTHVDELRARLTEYRDALITEAVTGQFDVTAVSEQQMDERMHEAIESPSA